MIDLMVELWTNFAISGQPAKASWRAAASKLEYVKLAKGRIIQTENDEIDMKRKKLWQEIAPEIYGF